MCIRDRGMTLASAELLQLGVTTSCEMYFHEDAVADAVLAAGSRVVITPAALSLARPEDAAAAGDAWWAERLEEVSDFHARRHGESGRIEVGFGPCLLYTSDAADDLTRVDLG